jgi:hypothetical protein
VRPRAQVVNSAAETKKRIKVRVVLAHGKGAKRKLYSTEGFRLRVAPPAVEDAVAPPAPSLAAAEEDDGDDLALAQLLMQRVATLFPSLKDVKPNPRLMAPGGPAGLLRPFRKAVARAAEDVGAAGSAAAAARHIHLLLHGTPEPNVNSILATSLRGRQYCNTRWFTNSVDIAGQYARGATRMIIFAVFRPLECAYGGYAGLPAGGPTIYTLREDAHHVPLFVARRSGM